MDTYYQFFGTLLGSYCGIFRVFESSLEFGIFLESVLETCCCSFGFLLGNHGSYPIRDLSVESRPPPWYPLWSLESFGSQYWTAAVSLDFFLETIGPILYGTSVSKAGYRLGILFGVWNLLISSLEFGIFWESVLETYCCFLWISSWNSSALSHARPRC